MKRGTTRGQIISRVGSIHHWDTKSLFNKFLLLDLIVQDPCDFGCKNLLPAERAFFIRNIPDQIEPPLDSQVNLAHRLTHLILADRAFHGLLRLLLKSLSHSSGFNVGSSHIQGISDSLLNQAKKVAGRIKISHEDISPRRTGSLMLFPRLSPCRQKQNRITLPIPLPPLPVTGQ